MKGEPSSVLSHIFGLPAPALGTVVNATKKLMKQSNNVARSGFMHNCWHPSKSLLEAVVDLLSLPLYVVLLGMAFSDLKGGAKPSDGHVLN